MSGSSFSERALELLSRLADRPWSDDVYLAGSAALATYIEHRPIHAFDLMCGTNRLTGSERRELLFDLVPALPEVEVETARDSYLFVRVGGGSQEGFGVKFFYYPYPLVDPEEEFCGLPVASRVDLGLMKIAAIISRGTRRDFVDLYLLCRSLPLGTLLERSGDKFGHVRDFPLQALKGLADLSLVDGEPMPSLGRPVAWEEVETWLHGEVRRLGRTHVGLAPEPEVTKKR